CAREGTTVEAYYYAMDYW
nr:immunoglobulin heavy chain junction region [Mus musculus]